MMINPWRKKATPQQQNHLCSWLLLWLALWCF